MTINVFNFNINQHFYPCKIHKLNNNCSSLWQENVGGTTYFYQASASSDSHNSTDSLSVGPINSNIGASYQCYPGTPSHLQGIKPNPRTGGNGSFFVSDDLRMEIIHKNALTLMQPDHEQFPGI